MTTEQTATITITQDTGYRFSIDFGAAIPALQTDEVHPISDGDGPCPEHRRSFIGKILGEEK